MSMIDNATRKTPSIRDVMPSMRTGAASEEGGVNPLPTMPVTQSRGLRLRVSERRVVLTVVDILLVNLALIVAASLSGTLTPTFDNILAYNKWFIVLTVVWYGVAIFFDNYSLARAASTTASLKSSLLAASLTVVLYTFIPFVTPQWEARSTFFAQLVLTVGAVATWRVVYARVFVQPSFQQRALVVGAGKAGQALAAAIQAAPANDANPYRGTGYQLLGFIDDDPARRSTMIEGVPVLGDHHAMAQVAKQLHVDEIILAITHRHAIDDDLFNALLHCRELGLRVVTMATVYERLTGRLPIDHVGRDLEMVVPMDDNAGERAYQALKRVMDLLFGSAGLVLMGLVIIPIAISNARHSPGPLFYKQRRIGQGGKIFEVYKFRSMRPDAEKSTGAVWAQKNDDRITPAGAPAQDAAGRNAAVHQRPEGRDECDRAAPRAPGIRQCAVVDAAVLSRATRRKAGHHRLGADSLWLWQHQRRFARQTGIRPVLRQACQSAARSAHRIADAAGHAAGQGYLTRRGFLSAPAVDFHYNERYDQLNALLRWLVPSASHRNMVYAREISLLDIQHFIELALSLFQIITFIGLIYHYCLLLASLPHRSARPHQTPPTKRFAIVIPAHNEALVIGNTVRQLTRQTYPAELYDIYVAADYCTDNTAQMARDAGAICYERNEGVRGRKAYPLQWLLEQIVTGPRRYDAIAIFDADSQVDVEFLGRMADELQAGATALQGQHVIVNPGDSSLSRLAAIDMRLNNLLRNRAKRNLGLSSRLMGDAMCFASDLIRIHGWGGKSLAEDREFEMYLLLHGQRVQYVPEAISNGQAVSRWSDASQQRVRWYGGVFDLQRKFAGKLLKHGLRTRDLAVLDRAIELLLPSYSTLSVATLGLLGLQTVVACAHVVLANLVHAAQCNGVD